jgi:hypothetical protein
MGPEGVPVMVGTEPVGSCETGLACTAGSQERQTAMNITLENKMGFAHREGIITPQHREKGYLDSYGRKLIDQRY